MDGVPGDQIICLNVGGVRFSTTIRTMCRFPDTLIGRFFFEQLQGRRGTLPTKDGHSFIDRDGTHFRHILNFLRTPTGYKVEVGGNDLRELRCECVYYGIDKLMFPGTERRLRFCNMRNDTGAIAVRFDVVGVPTIRDTAEPINYCKSCDTGYFNIGAESCRIRSFATQLKVPAAQLPVQGQCANCFP